MPGNIFAGVFETRSYVYDGSLAVERTIDPEFRKAETYLRGDAVMRRALDDLERGSSMTTIDADAFAVDRFSPATRTIDWDPYAAFRTTSGGRQSPALALGHELAHADIDPKIQHRLGAIQLPKFTNAEERRVIVGAETHAARTLGEGVRQDHAGPPYAVSSPTGRF